MEGMMAGMLDLDIAVCEPQDVRKYERSHQEAIGLGRAMVNFKPMCMWSILAGSEATTTHAM